MNNRFTNEKFLKIYYAFFSASAIAFFVMLYVSNGQSFSDTLFRNSVGSDFFMDFFNSIRDASTKEVYKNHIIYPPLANIFFYILSNMIDPDLASTTFSRRSLLQRDYVCLFLYFVFVVLCLLMFVRMVKKYLEKNNLHRFSFTVPILLLFSYPMIYCIQRGNIALLSLVFTMFFIFYRDSDNKFIRELSFILLAVAAGIKLYPALFGLLLLTDKKFKEAVRLVIYGVIFLVVPFFFYDGFESIQDLIYNLGLFSDFSSEKISPAFVCVDIIALYISMIFNVKFSVVYSFLVTVTYMSAAAILIFSPRQWQKVWAICFMIMNLSSTGRTYILIFAIIPFIMFAVSEKFRKRDIVYYIVFLLLLLVLVPLYCMYSDTFINWISQFIDTADKNIFEILRYINSPNQLLSAFLVSFMTMFMFVDVLIGIAKEEIVLLNRYKKIS